MPNTATPARVSDFLFTRQSPPSDPEEYFDAGSRQQAYIGRLLTDTRRVYAFTCLGLLKTFEHREAGCDCSPGN